ncbi:ATP-binding cassette domain-containing protein [Candidatus Bipolaricaulota bacterium]|nr:ATP-binding cassette domain-containing protein [Candidatus Bipolaricaulota bacterium]
MAERIEPGRSDERKAVKRAKYVLMVLSGKGGVGKATMIRILTGLFRPTAGKVFASGRDARTKSVQGENWSVIVPHKSWKGS